MSLAVPCTSKTIALFKSARLTPSVTPTAPPDTVTDPTSASSKLAFPALIIFDALSSISTVPAWRLISWTFLMKFNFSIEIGSPLFV